MHGLEGWDIGAVPLKLKYERNRKQKAVPEKKHESRIKDAVTKDAWTIENYCPIDVIVKCLKKKRKKKKEGKSTVQAIG